MGRGLLQRVPRAGLLRLGAVGVLCRASIPSWAKIPGWAGVCSRACALDRGGRRQARGCRIADRPAGTLGCARALIRAPGRVAAGRPAGTCAVARQPAGTCAIARWPAGTRAIGGGPASARALAGT